MMQYYAFGGMQLYDIEDLNDMQMHRDLPNMRIMYNKERSFLFLMLMVGVMH